MKSKSFVLQKDIILLWYRDNDILIIMYNRRFVLLMFFILGPITMWAQKTNWIVESESADYRASFKKDTVELFAPKGLTLWWKQKLCGDVCIEYDACVMDEGRTGDRLSDLNCFWMASDPHNPNNIFKRKDWRSGVFDRCYSLQTYYLGYGGNSNKTTRFRRYDGDYDGFLSKGIRPNVLCEYTDRDHLLKPNKWYHIRIMSRGNKTSYEINGERIVDFNDSHPLKSGWFGFRTTLSHTKVAHFKVTSLGDVNASPILLHWIGTAPTVATPVSFGVPFTKGRVKSDTSFSLADSNGNAAATDFRPMAYWSDGSVKWGGFAVNAPGKSDSLILRVGVKSHEKRKSKLIVEQSNGHIVVHTGLISAYLSTVGHCLFDSIVYNHTRVAGAAELICRTESRYIQSDQAVYTYRDYQSEVTKMTVEKSGQVKSVIKIEGMHCNKERKWLPFVVRLYFYAGSEQIRLVHTIIYDGDQNHDYIKGLGVRFEVPLREALYNRHVAFSADGDSVWSEPVQPLVGRRVLQPGLYEKQLAGQRVPEYKTFDEKGRDLIDHWASWGGYRLSQLNSDAFSIRKQATGINPWIGTFTGKRSSGFAFVGDVSGGLGVTLQNFWQSYPSSLQVDSARTSSSRLTVWLWSPEAEAMDLQHYDNVAHGLEEAYEDVQAGMSTPLGIGRTSVLMLHPMSCFPGTTVLSNIATFNSSSPQLICTPGYLHDCHAFGVWSLPDRSTDKRAMIEDQLNAFVDYYKKAIDNYHWYGFWNYGDVMHTYDPARHVWLYDVGGYAWDNTELASNMWLWYSFLRTGRADVWKMAEAMTRHTTEVDVYHLGDLAGLGSRHNVSHWGCGAKEARISQAAWNRFYYYLTTDERSGDLMTAEKDVDQLLYKIDPMRLAQPRSQFPCTAPARLRIGPDWLAYAGNWMTEWERTRNNVYRDKVVTGMKSIASLPHGLFTGPKVLGYDPKTGVVSYEGNADIQNTNHLMTIMGGFEVMNEMLEMVDVPEWNKAWLDHAAHYTQMMNELGGSHFFVPKLTAYAAYELSDPALASQAWKELLPHGLKTIDYQPESTNSVATWALNAIYMEEVIPVR